MDCIHKVFMKRAFDPKVIEATCHEWIMMFIRIVSFTDDMANYHFKPFLHSEPEVLQMKAIRAEIIMHVSQLSFATCLDTYNKPQSKLLWLY